MALPTLDATFASFADLPRRQMLAKWLVEELGETQAPSNVLVSGFDSYGEYNPNGKFLYLEILNAKPKYLNEFNNIAIEWTGDSWSIYITDGPNIGDGLFYSEEDVAYPWLVTNWTANNGSGNPVVTEVPAPSPLSNYYSLPERYLWAKIAVAAGAPREEADYISLPKNYAWSDIYNAVAGSSGNHTDWSENVALGHIAAAYRGDTGNPANLATYIDWPWRYKVASIIDATSVCSDADAGVLIGGNFLYKIADKYYSDGTYEITYGSGQWLHEEIGVSTIDIVTSSEEYPWLAGLGEKDCFAKFSNLPNAVIVSGAGLNSSNGTYVFSSILFGRPMYTLNSNTISWNGAWYLYDDLGSVNTYASTDDVLFPWLGTWIVEDGSSPVPTLTPTTV